MGEVEEEITEKGLTWKQIMPGRLPSGLKRYIRYRGESATWRKKEQKNVTIERDKVTLRDKATEDLSEHRFF